MDHRVITIQSSIFIEREDSNKAIRLKDFCDISADGFVESIDRSDKRPIVHWTSQGKNTTLRIADDKTINEVTGLLENHNYPIGTIVQLERIGYAIIEDNGLLMVHD